MHSNQKMIATLDNLNLKLAQAKGAKSQKQCDRVWKVGEGARESERER